MNNFLLLFTTSSRISSTLSSHFIGVNNGGDRLSSAVSERAARKEQSRDFNQWSRLTRLTDERTTNEFIVHHAQCVCSPDGPARARGIRRNKKTLRTTRYQVLGLGSLVSSSNTNETQIVVDEKHPKGLQQENNS
jgi:hypothetical protein